MKKMAVNIIQREGADMLTGETAELLAEECGISREEQNTFVLESPRKPVPSQASATPEAPW